MLKLLAFTLTALLLTAACRENDPDPVDEPPPLTPLEIDLACAKLVACSPAGGDSTSQCALSAMSRPASGLRPTEELLDCLEAGDDCQALLSCIPALTGDPCDGRGQATLCLGDTLVACFGDQVSYSSDCAAWGLGCVLIDGEATCQGDGRSCLRGDEACEGGDAVMCVGTRQVVFDCSRLVLGRQCVTDDEGRARCVAPDAECDPITTVDSCEGDELLYCSSDGRAARLDCAALGFGGCVDLGGQGRCGTVEE